MKICSDYIRCDIGQQVCQDIDKQHPTKIEWVCLLLYLTAFSCASLVIIMFFWQHTDYNSTHYMLETDYLHWTSAVPAVSVCGIPNASVLDHAAMSLATAEKDHQLFTPFLHGLLRPDKQYCQHCDSLIPCSTCQSWDLSQLLHKLTSKCEEVFKQCLWKDQEIDCCANFKPLLTRHGKCFSLNSRQTERSMQGEEFVVNYHDKKAVLDMTFALPVQVFIHDSTDVGFLRGRGELGKIEMGQQAEIMYGTREVHVHPSAWDLNRQQRNCILPGELHLRHHRYYSQSTCLEECVLRRQLHACNCSHPLLSGHKGEEKICNMEGLQCLDHHFKKRRSGGTKRVKKSKKKCNCLPECESLDINIARNTIVWTGEESIKATVEMLSPPTERLTLYARVTPIDVIVGMACLSRLFTSMSLPQVSAFMLNLLRHLCHFFSRRNTQNLNEIQEMKLQH